MAKKIKKEDVLKFLKKHFIMEIATISKNKPQASVVLYYIDDNFNIYFETHKETYKSKNLLKNPSISLTIWEHSKMLVQADGTTSVVKNKKRQHEIMDKLAESASMDEGFWPPLFRTGGKKYILFKIKPNWIRELDLVEKNITSKETPFVEIKF